MKLPLKNFSFRHPEAKPKDHVFRFFVDTSSLLRMTNVENRFFLVLTMKFIRVLFFLAALFMPLVPALADITVKAEVDAPAITTGDLLTYKLAVSSTEKNIPSPQLPEFKNWAIVSQAQSSSVSFQKGGAQSVLVFVFILLPKKSGKLNIEAAQVTAKGKLYLSDAFQIEVKQGNARLPEETSPEIPDSEQPKYNL